MTTTDLYLHKETAGHSLLTQWYSWPCCSHDNYRSLFTQGDSWPLFTYTMTWLAVLEPWQLQIFIYTRRQLATLYLHNDMAGRVAAQHHEVEEWVCDVIGTGGEDVQVGTQTTLWADIGDELPQSGKEDVPTAQTWGESRTVTISFLILDITLLKIPMLLGQCCNINLPCF